MKATGIVRKIDDLGRIVIPKEIRRTLRIRDGDPLEIYTAEDGSVIFKKYSPIGGMSDCAGGICEAVSRVSGKPTAVADRDSFISSFGSARRTVNGKPVSRELARITGERSAYSRTENDAAIRVTDSTDSFIVDAAAPIVASGDLIGCVVMYSDGKALPGETELKLVQTAADFLANQIQA